MEEDEDALLSFLRCLLLLLLLLSLVALVVGEVEEDVDEAAADDDVTGGDEGVLITWSESFEVAPKNAKKHVFVTCSEQLHSSVIYVMMLETCCF